MMIEAPVCRKEEKPHGKDGRELHKTVAAGPPALREAWEGDVEKFDGAVAGGGG